ncbi:putative ribonuclease H-like domain-containing protein, partial [Tanacetum coccineum]
VDAMQEELLQFKIQKVWILVDFPYGKKAIGTKLGPNRELRRNERGIVVRKSKMDVKSAFLYGTIDKEVYVSQPPGFIDPKFTKKVYKVVKALYGLHQAQRAWSWCDEFEALMKSRFQMSSMGELTFFLGSQVKQKKDGIFISQDKYVAEILKKFDFASMKTASTPIETQKSLTKDEEAADVDIWKRISDKRTKNQAKTDKTEHGMEKHGKDKVKSKPKSTPTKSKPRSHQVKENTTLGTKFAKS